VLFTTRYEQIAALASRYGVPTIFPWREFATAGGLMSYGTSTTDAYRLAGTYAGRKSASTTLIGMRLIGMRNVILVLGWLLAFSAASATAENVGSTRYALDAYDKMLPEDRRIVENFINGIEEGLSWANVVLKNQRQPPLYCQPDRLSITVPQIIGVMRREINNDPALGDYPLGMVALIALQRTFTCRR
jgi:hypothetical protein